MRRLILAAGFVAAAMPASAGAPGFNPGTVISNVLENPPPGCVFGFGYICSSAPGQGYYNYAPGYSRQHNKASAARG